VTAIEISAATAADYPDILTLNEAAVPAVNLIPRARLEHLHQQSLHLLVARNGRDIAGFLLALPETADYDSINFDYFRRSYPRFVYIDRIVVSDRIRRSGVGVALYRDLESMLPESSPMMACEVNLHPPNPQSLAFHQRLGFEAVGEQETEGGTKRVCLMARRLV